MIRVRMDMEDGSFRELKSTGHAMHSEAGTDIVCAGVSSLLYAVLNTLTEGLKLRVHKRIADGRMVFRIIDEGWKSPSAQAVMKVALFGIRGLEREYPDHVSLEVRRTGKC